MLLILLSRLRPRELGRLRILSGVGVIESFSGIVKFSRFLGSRSFVYLDSWIEIIGPQCANAIIEYVRTENSLLLFETPLHVVSTCYFSFLCQILECHQVFLLSEICLWCSFSGDSSGKLLWKAAGAHAWEVFFGGSRRFAQWQFSTKILGWFLCPNDTPLSVMFFSMSVSRLVGTAGEPPSLPTKYPLVD